MAEYVDINQASQLVEKSYRTVQRKVVELQKKDKENASKYIRREGTKKKYKYYIEKGYLLMQFGLVGKMTEEQEKVEGEYIDIIKENSYLKAENEQLKVRIEKSENDEVRWQNRYDALLSGAAQLPEPKKDEFMFEETDFSKGTVTTEQVERDEGELETDADFADNEGVRKVESPRVNWTQILQYIVILGLLTLTLYMAIKEGYIPF